MNNIFLISSVWMAYLEMEHACVMKGLEEQTVKFALTQRSMEKIAH